MPKLHSNRSDNDSECINDVLTTTVHYRVGDLVWARIKGYSNWPSMIVDQRDLPNHPSLIPKRDSSAFSGAATKSQLSGIPMMYPVRFFCLGTAQYSLVKEADIYPLISSEGEILLKKRNLFSAIRIMIQFCQGGLGGVDEDISDENSNLAVAGLGVNAVIPKWEKPDGRLYEKELEWLENTFQPNLTGGGGSSSKAGSSSGSVKSASSTAAGVGKKSAKKPPTELSKHNFTANFEPKVGLKNFEISEGSSNAVESTSQPVKRKYAKKPKIIDSRTRVGLGSEDKNGVSNLKSGPVKSSRRSAATAALGEMLEETNSFDNLRGIKSGHDGSDLNFNSVAGSIGTRKRPAAAVNGAEAGGENKPGVKMAATRGKKPKLEDIGVKNPPEKSKSGTAVDRNGLLNQVDLVPESLSNDTRKQFQQIGFIGLGPVGRAIAEKIIKDLNYAQLFLFHPDATGSSYAPLMVLDKKIVACASAAEVVSRSTLILVCLLDNEAFKQEFLYHSEHLLGLESLNGKDIINFTSINLSVSMETDEVIASLGGRYLECAVEGATDDVAKMELILFASGSRDMFELVEELFRVICRKAIFYGSAGNSIKVKYCLQILRGNMVAALDETFVFADSMGVAHQDLMDMLSISNLNSDMIQSCCSRLRSGQFEGGTRLGTVQSDIHEALDLSQISMTCLPVTAATKEALKAKRAEGAGELDCAVVCRDAFVG